MLHCETAVEVCRSWNESRQGPTYSTEVFRDLAGRFEAPDTRNRWDTPLIRVDPCAGSDLSEELGQALAAVTGRPPASSGARSTEALTPNLATKNPELSTTNLLNELDRAAQVRICRLDYTELSMPLLSPLDGLRSKCCILVLHRLRVLGVLGVSMASIQIGWLQEVVSAVMDAQARVGGEAAGTVEIPGVLSGLLLQRTVQLPELRRQKRAFLKLATQNNWTRLRDAGDARRVFVEYLQHNLDP